MRLSMASFLLLCGCLSISAQPASQDTPPTLRVSTQLVLLDASVEVKKTGARIPGLTLADFTLTEDRKPQTLDLSLVG